MKRVFYAVIIVFLVSLLGAPCVNADSSHRAAVNTTLGASPIALHPAQATDRLTQAPLPYVGDQLVVRFNAVTTTGGAPAIVSELGLDPTSNLSDLGIFVLQTPPGEMASVMATLQNDPDVAWVEPNYLVEEALLPNDPDYNDPEKVYAPQLINAPVGWDALYPSPDIILAMVDSGLALTHPEFIGRVLPGYNFVSKDDDPSDDRGHGTHVTGIAAATLDNAAGIAGIAPNVGIMPIKVLNSSGIGTSANVASGILYAVDHGAAVINLSLVLPWDTQVLRDSVQYATDNDVLMVAAAGNTGFEYVFYPAAYPAVMAVGATDRNDESYALSNPASFVDVSAPGVDIWSTDWSADQPSGYASRSGTSMATAHVSGLAALLLSFQPILTPSDLQAVIQQTAVDLGDPGWDPRFGDGRIDVGAAVTRVRSLYVRRVNCGDKAYTDSQGLTWDVDQKWDGAWGARDGNKQDTKKSVEGTGDDALYQAWRKNPKDYRFALSNGAYRITLHFAGFEADKIGERVMQIGIEDAIVEPGLDIFATVGRNTALDKTYQTTVTDGELNITFTKIAGKDPIVAAIEVAATLPSGGEPSYTRWINSGDKAYTDSQGVTWDVDQKWDGAWGARDGDNKNSSEPVEGTNEDLLYQTWRRNPQNYRFAAPNGTYRITLRFAEFEVSKVGERVMQISIEDAIVESGLDIFATVGRYTALDRTYQATVADGELNITFTKSAGKDPIVAAIEVRSR